MKKNIAALLLGMAVVGQTGLMAQAEDANPAAILLVPFKVATGMTGAVLGAPVGMVNGIWDMEPPDLGGYFIEMRPYIGHCRFPDCTHDHEPGCAVGEAVDEGLISPERYGSYLNILASVREGESDVGR